MGQLNNLYVSSSFQGLLKLTDSTQGLTNTLQTIQGGNGSNSPLQMSTTDVNISGSFYINNVPITNGTNGTSGTSGAAGSSGSSGTSGDSLFALTGSVWNTTNNVGITGSLIVSGSNINLLGNVNSIIPVNKITGRTVIQGGNGVIGGNTPRLIISGSDNVKSQFGRNFISIESLTVPGFGANINMYGDDTSVVSYVQGVYNPNDYSNDYELLIATSTGGTQFKDFDNFNVFDYEDFLVIPPNLGDSPAPQFTRGLGVTGSINITGQYLVNGVPISGSGAGDRNGLITTGSITDTQQITGSLILGNTVISGSLIGNTVNGGLIKIQSEANRSGSVQFNITGSSPISQSNFVFGGAGPTAANLTGSVVISGSNNIILNGGRTNTLAQGTYGYIGGNNNIVSAIPQIATGSLNIITTNN